MHGNEDRLRIFIEIIEIIDSNDSTHENPPELVFITFIRLTDL